MTQQYSQRSRPAKPRFGRQFEIACFAIIPSSSIVVPSATALPELPEQNSADGAFMTGIMNKRRLVDNASQAANKQLERTVIGRHVRAACASFHCAHAARWTRGHAAAQLRRYATEEVS